MMVAVLLSVRTLKVSTNSSVCPPACMSLVDLMLTCRLYMSRCRSLSHGSTPPLKQIKARRLLRNLIFTGLFIFTVSKMKYNAFKNSKVRGSLIKGCVPEIHSRNVLARKPRQNLKF